jgi:ribosome-binding protein aMBF1 (putative translation factor)
MSHSGLLHHYRKQRDELIRQAYAESGMSYGSLARQIGCSPELVAKAVQGRT